MKEIPFEKIQAVKIDPDSRYLIILKTDCPLAPGEIENLRENCHELLKDILAGVTHQIIVLPGDDDMEITVFKVNSES